jgi:hypothetical protein
MATGGGWVCKNKQMSKIHNSKSNKEIKRDYQQVFSSSSSVSTANLSFLALL